MATCPSSALPPCAGWPTRRRPGASRSSPRISQTPRAMGASCATRTARWRRSSRKRTRALSSAPSARSTPASSPRRELGAWLARLGNDNAQREYYLTDIVAAAVADGVAIEVRQPSAAFECLGVNSKRELALLERRYQMSQADDLLES